MKRINVIAIRHQGDDDDTCGCCGCGKESTIYYEIIGRNDHEKKEYNFSIFLCYQCYRPLMKVLETKDPSKQKGSLV